MAPSPCVIILIADGARPDTLAALMRSGETPALARLRDEGAAHTITTVFPSVTGPAYTPFLMGRHPGSVGLPGLRWYDRARRTCRWPSYARSYVGIGMRHVDRDLVSDTPTLFELAPSSLGALSVIGRGLPPRQRIGRGLRFAARTAVTHFRGDVRGWLALDRAVGDVIVRRVREERPAFMLAAFTGIDKTSHATGHTSDAVHDAVHIVDQVAARLRADAERGGYWSSTHLWIVSDHGHSPVHAHDDLAMRLRTLGWRVLAHPWTATLRPDVAVMVSGNAMAHLYLAPDRAERPDIGARDRWTTLADTLVQRDSVDLMLIPRSLTACELRTRDRGTALVTWTAGDSADHSDATYSYAPETGDPLGIGPVECATDSAAYAVTLESDYPDALVQIARLCVSTRRGDIILSAARGWDFRAWYEPIPHVSSHGAMHREHMLVPLITSRPPRTAPRRTVDIMPAAARLLGVEPGAVEGKAFV